MDSSLSILAAPAACRHRILALAAPTPWNADRLVPFNGGSTPYQMGSKRSDTPVMDTVCFWVERHGCSSEPEHSKNSGARVSIYSGCKDGTGVAMYASRHMWPGCPISENALPASELIWGFFVQHPKQSVAIRLD